MTPSSAPTPPGDPAGTLAATRCAWGPDQVAAYLRISRRHLTELRATDPTFPKPRMLGSLPRWRPGAVIRWLDPDPAPPAPPAPAPGTGRRSRTEVGRVR